MHITPVAMRTPLLGTVEIFWDLYNVVYTVSTQQYISTVIQYIQLGHIAATRFYRKRSSSGKKMTVYGQNM